MTTSSDAAALYLTGKLPDIAYSRTLLSPLFYWRTDLHPYHYKGKGSSDKLDMLV